MDDPVIDIRAAGDIRFVCPRCQHGITLAAAGANCLVKTTGLPVCSSCCHAMHPHARAAAGWRPMEVRFVAAAD